MLAGLAIALLVEARVAWAREAESEVAAPVPCALITEVAGEVDVLDSTRTHLLDSSKRSAVPCGGWVSVGKGAVELHHRDGFTVHVGSGSFVQFAEPNTDGKNSGDHVVLFRGQLFAQAGGGNGELRVVTANSRARMRRGSAVVVYNHEDEETQLIALDASSSLENRFEPSRSVIAKAGEATSLNFKQLRVVPSTPRAVALAALKPKFDDLRVPSRDRTASLHSAQKRQERIFATALVEEEGEAPTVAPEPKRGVASVEDPGVEVRARLKSQVKSMPSPQSYASHVDDAQTQAVRKKWVKRLVAGETAAEAMVAPAQPKPKTHESQSQVEVVDLATGVVGRRAKAHKLTAEDEEKLKLIDELSRIREE